MDLKTTLKEVIPDNALKLLSGRFEVIGDIAIIQIPPGCLPYKEEIADAVFSIRKNVRTVLQKTSSIGGECRVGGFEFLKGENKTKIVHKEAGYLYRTDLSSVFFSTKLSFERMRISSVVNPDEKIIIPFCGCGPFAVPAADKGAEVLGVEKNPSACRYFLENLKLNGIRDKGDVICADAHSIPEFFNERDCFDRAIIPTAYGMDEALFKTLPLVKKGGTIHFYTFKAKEERENLIQNLKEKGLHTDYHRCCGNIAPGIHRYVFDLKKMH